MVSLHIYNANGEHTQMLITDELTALKNYVFSKELSIPVRVKKIEPTTYIGENGNHIFKYTVYFDDNSYYVYDGIELD